jgi:hypothetical protein
MAAPAFNRFRAIGAPMLSADVATLGGNHDRAAINRRLDSHQLDYVFVPEQQKSAKCDIFIEETTR